MANEVRTLVEEIIEAYPVGAQIPVDDIEDSLRANGKDIEHADIYNALREIQNTTDKGVLVLGRRQKPTRFCKGFMRVSPTLNQTDLTTLRADIMAVEKGKDYPLDKAEAIFNDRAKAIEALRSLETEGLGVFLIGRRGGTSRFTVGISRDEMSNKSKAVIMPSHKLASPKTGPFADPPTLSNEASNPKPELKYQYMNNLIFKTPFGSHDTIESVLEMIGYAGDRVEHIKQNLELYGHFNMASISESSTTPAEGDSASAVLEDMEEISDNNEDIS